MDDSSEVIGCPVSRKIAQKHRPHRRRQNINTITSPLYRKFFSRILLIGILSSWAIVVSYIAISQRAQTLLIGIDESGTRIIKRNDDPLLRKEVTHFINEFVLLYYTFDSKTFTRNIGKATDFFSEDLWREKESELLKLSQKMKEEPLQQFAILKQINRKGENEFPLILEITIQRRLNTFRVKLLSTLTLRKVKRKRSNPYGLEVTKIEERNLD